MASPLIPSVALDTPEARALWGLERKNRPASFNLFQRNPFSRHDVFVFLLCRIELTWRTFRWQRKCWQQRFWRDGGKRRQLDRVSDLIDLL